MNAHTLKRTQYIGTCDMSVLTPTMGQIVVFGYEPLKCNLIVERTNLNKF